MPLPSRAVEKFRQDGLWPLLAGIGRYVRSGAAENSRAVAFRARRWLSGSSVLRQEGVKLDASASCISPELRAEIVRERDYELEECVLCRQHVDRTTDVIELGGGIGFVACCLSRELDDVRHLVFEANPALVPTIERHRELNDCDFEVINKAYTPTGGRVELYLQEDVRSSTTRDERSESGVDPAAVDAVSLADIVSQYGLDTFTLVIDIEGTEVDLVAQEDTLLAERCRTLVVEFHDFIDEPVEHTRERLERIGFVRTASRGSTEVYVNYTID